jgi:hypothetical protein
MKRSKTSTHAAILCQHERRTHGHSRLAGGVAPQTPSRTITVGAPGSVSREIRKVRSVR